jgi:predicted RNA-binding protein with PUA-like domain
MQHWLMKSEPSVFGIEDLERAPGRTTAWDGVRNYQARNYIRAIKSGEPVFFYHSNCEIPGIVGLMEVVREAYPDPTAFDPEHRYYDPKSDPANPRWYQVDVRFVRRLSGLISLSELKEQAPLADMPLVHRGNRLSVMPVSPTQWEFILGLERSAPSGGRSRP